MTYDEQDLCRSCGEHLSDPHAPGCPAGDPQAEAHVDDDRVLLSYAGRTVTVELAPDWRGMNDHTLGHWSLPLDDAARRRLLELGVSAAMVDRIDTPATAELVALAVAVKLSAFPILLGWRCTSELSTTRPDVLEVALDDPTGPNGGRRFVLEVREVDA